MFSQYAENPILLVNTTGPHAASGRNVRAQFRTREAAKRPRPESQPGQFGVFDATASLTQSTLEDAGHARKRSREENPSLARNVGHNGDRPNEVIRKPLLPIPPNCTGLMSSNTAHSNPKEVLAYAIFHIRLMASMALSGDATRLSQVLLCRQWSCISLPNYRLGHDQVLDSCMECVTAKVAQLNNPTSESLHDLVIYEEALSKLQAALRNPAQHDSVDLRASIQLLAMFEMLQSLDNPGWLSHVSGMKLLSQPQAMTFDVLHNDRDLTYALTIPIAAEAFLTGDDKLFEARPWRDLLHSACNGNELICRRSVGFTTSLIDLPMLMSDVKIARWAPYGLDSIKKDSLLNRARVLKSRIRSDVLNEDAYTAHSGTTLGTFDELGICLAGLIALDRIINSLRSDSADARRAVEQTTELFCEQMLHLDIGAGGAYAAADLMKAFHMSPFARQGAFIVVLPGRGGAFETEYGNCRC